jgi:hypothetical protein
MPASKPAVSRSTSTLNDVLALLTDALEGSLRRDVVAHAAGAGDFTTALQRLRDGMRANVWTVKGVTCDLSRAVQRYDRKTRTLGFHVLHDWDGIADRVNDDTIPVDVLHYLIDKRGAAPVDPAALAILLDYHFVHLLALLTLRVWDEGDPNENLDRIAALLAALQGPQGSGQPFAADAETLLLIATSHYELHERGYAVLLDQTRTLDAAHQTRIALGHGASMGCHLRFGFEATYGRDTINMRNDNVADYPWLCFALATLMKEYLRLRAAGDHGEARRRCVESMLNGLSADARAIIGAPPASLSGSEAERAEFAASFTDVKDDLLQEFEAFRPVETAYSPLCFFFNFSHNVLKGTVIDALLQSRPWPLPFNGLLTAIDADPEASATKIALAETLMAYARANPHRIRGRLRPVIVYDVASGREAFSVTMRKLRQ